ncbi:MAG: 50S ribosomal protein L4 [Elusimicrobia bacterium]|nr:50S ribosomal protein L4 [Elusimicrobiota bacterium]
MDITLYNMSGKEKGKIELPPVFDTKVSPTLLHEVIVGYLSNQRSGTHSTKTRGEVSGGGVKPWKQKGTGNARAGSIRSPLWRKGGITFGPKPRDYSQRVPKQKKRVTLNMALASKFKDGNIIVVDDIKIEEAKTKKVAEILKNLKIENNKVLLVGEKNEEKLKLATKNLPNFILSEVKNMNAYETMWADKIIFTANAIEQLRKVEVEKKAG